MPSKITGLLKNSSIYAAGTITAQVVAIVLVPVYTRVFSPDLYGVIDLIATVSALLTLAFIAGLDSAIARYFIDAESAAERKATASTGLFYITAISFVVVAAVAPFSGVLSQLLFNSSDYWPVFLMALVVVPFAVLTAMFNNLLRFKFQPVRSALLSVGAPLLQTVLTIWLVVFMSSGIMGIYVAALAANVIASAVGFLLTREDLAPAFSWQSLKRLLNFGIPYLLLSLALYVMTYSSRYFLKYYGGLEEVGLYGVGYRLASAIGVVTIGFELAWGPFVISTYKDSDSRATYARVFDYASVIVCLAVLGLSLFSRELLYIFATPAYAEAYRVMPFIAASIVTYTMGAYFAVGIGLSKKTVHMGWVGLLTAVVSILLNVLLIPTLGMTGAAVAAWTSYIIMAVILMAISQRYYFIPYRLSRNIVMFVITALVIFIAYFYLMNAISWTGILIKLLILAGFLGIPFALKLVGKQEVASLASIIDKYINVKTGKNEN